jgi:predicted O-linked N-acetylglucosamine transferase (SPINDLY family)
MNEPSADGDSMAVAISHAMQHATVAYTRGKWAEAERVCRRILAARGDCFDALSLLGVIAAQTRRAEEAARLLGRAVAANQHAATAHNNYGNVLKDLGRFEDALDSYERALKLDPGYADVCNNRGDTLQQLGRFEEALDSFEHAVKLKPDYAEAYYNRGNTLLELKRFEAALDSYERALKLKPGFAEAYNNRGNTLRELMRFEDALDSYERAVKFNADYAEAYNNQGNTLQDLGRPEAALDSYERVLKLKPGFAEAHCNRGNTLRELRRFEDALDSFERALKLKPDYAEAYNNQGNALRGLRRFEDALDSYERALKLNPGFAEAYKNRGNTLRALGRFEDALESYERARNLRPDLDWLYGAWLLFRRHRCEWKEIDPHIDCLVGKVKQQRKATPPFALLALTDSLAIQRQAAQILVDARYPEAPSRSPLKRRSGNRIRIGYYSADYQDHATAYLMAELFERHDRGRFELVGISYGADNRDEMRMRLSAAFDRFVDVRTKTDSEVAALSRDLGIDIAVDLKGFTEGARTGIFSRRAAPIQVNYLGYPGTMGAPYIDYIVADPILIPPESREHYTEKIVYLPNSYQVNDRKRRISDKEFTRAELGLPPTGFVFCCFNNNFKITPNTFDGWMRVLKQVEGSVLWLLEDNETAANNLRREAEARGVESGRLLFARRMTLPEHLARHRSADLFIDTLPYNAHTTASDALWAGLPVLTCVGESFAGRVAASLLNAVGLPELITATQEQYEAMAVALAGNATRLSELKEKLSRNRLTMPLFDTERFTKHLEDAYTQMYRRHQTGLSAEHIYVDADPAELCAIDLQEANSL